MITAAAAAAAAMVTNDTACKPPMKATSNGSWQGDNPLDYALPLIILQICIVVVLTRALAFVLRPLRQPRVVAEIIVRKHTVYIHTQAYSVYTHTFLLLDLIYSLFNIEFSVILCASV